MIGSCVDQPSLFINQSSSNLSQFSQIYWDINGVYFTGDSIYYVFDKEGVYNVSLSIQTNDACFDSTSKSIIINNNPTADFSYTPKDVSVLNPQVNFFNSSTNAIPIYWGFGDSSSDLSSNPVHIYGNPGIYDVLLVVEDSNQCVDSIYKEVIVYYDFILHVPNAFTPNNDSDNDVFSIKGIRMEKYQSFELLIFNSWGEKIYQTDDINNFWDGGDNPEDVYTWLIIIKDELGQIRKRHGLVNLLR
jgi:gliding motility-associated-like protein